MDNISAKTNYDGVTSPAPDDEVHSASEYNDRRAEMQNAVTESSQSLDSDDPKQLSKALFANGVRASSMTTSGTANVIQLTPVGGSLSLATPSTADYSLLDGAIFNFQAAYSSTGNVTINVGQTVGTLIGAVSLFLEDGSTEVPAGFIVAGRYYSIRYDAALDSAAGAFVLLERQFFLTGNKVVVTSSAADTTDTINAITSPFLQTDGKEAFTVTFSGLTVGDIIEIEAFAVLGNGAGNLPQAAIFVDSVSASLAVGCNDNDGTAVGNNCVNLKAWYTATSISHTFKLRFTGVGSTTYLNGAFGDTNISWISATRLNSSIFSLT